jgi:hypothetical protein
MSEAREAAPEDYAEELEILLPDREAELASGERVQVKELTFLQGLKAARRAGPLLEDLAQLFERELGAEDAGEDEGLGLADLGAVFAGHEDVLLELLAMSTGRSTEWLAALGDADGQAVLMTFWAVNSDFFVRRLVARQAGRMRSELVKHANKSAPPRPSPD